MRFIKVIYICVIALFFIPVLEQNIGFFERDPLAGYLTPAEKPQFSKDGYLNLSFQEQAEKYVNENFGFRNTLLRFRNQIYYTVLNQAPIPDYCIGKNKYLFESRYIDAYFGNNFVGDTVLDNLTTDIKTLQDTLANHHVTLITIVAPSKAWFFSEYIPNGFDLTPQDSNTNYDVFIKKIKSKDIQYMDFNAAFLADKKASLFPMYTRNGTHWSFYSATKSFNTILRKLEMLTGKKFPIMKYLYAESENSPNIADNDVARTFSLLCNESNGANVFLPHVKFEPVNGYVPKVLGVSDSYYGTLDELDLLGNCFESKDYWFGYSKFYPVQKYAHWNKQKSKLKVELENHEVIILMCTPHNIHKLGWGFIQDAICAYSKNGSKNYKYNFQDVVKLEDQMAYLRTNVDWFQAIMLQAKEEHLDPDKHFEHYAKWLNEEDKKKEKGPK